MNRMEVVRHHLAKYIDHTQLSPTATSEDIQKLCQEAQQHGFKSVCVHPSYVALARKELQGSSVLVCTVIGFPLGATTTTAKVAETKDAIRNGAQEIDMVIHQGKAQEGRWSDIGEEVRAIVQAAEGRTVKVILETTRLNPLQVKAACQVAQMAGAHFVKTSTGFAKEGGATEEAVRIMRKTVGSDFGVKASGGIGTKEKAEQMIKAGANRLETSSGCAIVQEDRKPVMSHY